MNWKNLEKIVQARGDAKLSDVEEASHPSNILLQIVLPTVLILAFVVVIKVQILEKKSKDLDILKNKILSEERGETLEKYRKSLLELQRQRLISALEKVKSERRKYFGIDIFSRIDVDAKADTLLNQDFKITCERTYNHLATVSSQVDEVRFIYKSVLDSAKIIDSELVESESDWQIEETPNQITNLNKSYIQKLIMEFIVRIAEEARDLQYESIYKIFNFYIENDIAMDELDKDLKKFREQYNIARTSDEKELYAKKLHNRLISKLAEKLDKQGFHFFEDTWQRISITI